jgi:ABC-type nickel/cobalt efflux system permease component RcnA
LVAIAVWMIWRAIRPARAHEHPGLFAVAAGLVPCPLTLFIVVMATSMGSPKAGPIFALAMLVVVGIVLSLVGLAAHLGAVRMGGIVGRFELVGRVVLGLGGAMLLLLVLIPLLR